MKIRKTRIKKLTKAKGSVQYVAEYKWGFWWYQFNDSMGPSGNARDIYFSYKIELRRKGEFFDFSEQQAEELIDTYVARVKYQNACEIENKVVKIECERYP